MKLTFTLTDPVCPYIVIMGDITIHSKLLLELLVQYSRTLDKLSDCIQTTAHLLEQQLVLPVGVGLPPPGVVRADGRVIDDSGRSHAECGNYVPEPVWH